jgi:putative acyl-CoA dehydrogenase
MALDLLRALRKRDANGVDALGALDRELAPARGANAAFDRFERALFARFADAADAGGDEAGARRLAQDVALAMQASLLQCHAPAASFDTFCASRLGDRGPQVYGTLPAGAPFETLIARAMPA